MLLGQDFTFDSKQNSVTRSAYYARESQSYFASS